jgi:hypothetical protein
VTTDAVGAQTQAVAVVDFIGTTQGIYRIVGEACSFLIAADIRVDQWADAQGNQTEDWAMQIGIARVTGETQDLAFVPQTGIYASSLLKEWRLYVLGTAGAAWDLALSAPITKGIWYRVQMELETASGFIAVEIRDLSDDTVLFDNSTFLPAWTADDGHYDAVVAVEGELTATTVANLAVVDNVHIEAVLCCPWDCAGPADGLVGISDFLLLLAQWSGPGTCDIDGGGVGITDFLDLLANWGPCP